MTAQPTPGELALLDPADRALLTRMDSIEMLLRDLLLDSEQESDFDQTFIVGGLLAAAVAIPIGLPRTLRHVEMTLSATSSVQVAALPGSLTTAQAAAQHSQTNASGGQSNAYLVSGGGAVTSRDYLDQSGWITIYFAAAITGYANLRIRQLDATQARLQST
jgi:hypothetical protein